MEEQKELIKKPMNAIKHIWFALRYGDWTCGYDEYKTYGTTFDLVECYYDGFIKVFYIGKFYVEVVY